MKVVEKIKHEPRMILAVIIFASLFLPWVSVEVSSSVEGVGEVAGGAGAVTGFALIQSSILGMLFIITPVIIFLLPLIEQTKSANRYLYLLIPVVSLVLMFFIGSFISGAGGMDVNIGGASVSSAVNKKIGFWIAAAGYVLVIGYTLMKDYDIKSGEYIKNTVQNIDVGNITSKVSNAAKDIGDSMQKTLFIECPQCMNRVQKGKKFCSKCGAAISVEEECSTITEDVTFKCDSCGEVLNKNTKFCPNCGKNVSAIKKPYELKCKKCGIQLTKKNKFCPECGTPAKEEA